MSPAGVEFLQQHPEYRALTPRELAQQIKQPRLAQRTWTKARARLGLTSTQTLHAFAIEYLKTHPEVHGWSNRTLEAMVTERSVSYFVWGKAKQALGIKAGKRGRRAIRREHVVVDTHTVIIDALQNELRVKTTNCPDEVWPFKQLRDWTVEFLAWVLEKKQYRKSYQDGAVTYSKSERGVQR